MWRRQCCHSYRTMLIVTELLKWFAIVAALYLSVWRYCAQLGRFPVFVQGAASPAGQFWGVFTAIMVGVSLLLYVPWRLVARRLRNKYRCVRDERWSEPCAIFYFHVMARFLTFYPLLLLRKSGNNVIT